MFCVQNIAVHTFLGGRFVTVFNMQCDAFTNYSTRSMTLLRTTLPTSARECKIVLVHND